MRAKENDSPRSLPKNREAEQIVLGQAILESEEVVPKILEKLEPEHFYWRANQTVYDVILELYELGKPIDLVTVANRLEEKDMLSQVGGRVYLSKLQNKVTTTTSVEHYSDIIREKALMRALIGAGREISELGYNESEELEKLLDQAEEMIFRISRFEKTQGYHLIRQFLHEHISNLEKLHQNPDRHTVTGVPTGFSKFDEMTSGLQPSELIVIAGRPSMGKTSLAISIARNVALREGLAIGIFSLEMRKEQLLERLLCGEGQINLHRLRGGFLPSRQWRRVVKAASALQESTILIDDTPSIPAIEMKAKARRMKAEYDIGLIIVDYLQLIEAGTNNVNREQQISHVSRSLKGLARELDIPVIAVSQLSRAVEYRQKKRPRLSDLRESGSIEQEADLVAFIYRGDYYEQESDLAEESENGQAEVTGKKSSPFISTTEIIIGKQRNGPVGKFKLSFHRNYASFYETAYSETEEAPF